MSTLPSWAVTGRKVVCVYDVPNGKVSVKLNKGSVYTISRVEFFTWRDGSTGWGLHLCEVVRKYVPSLGAIAPWGIYRFRPVIMLEEDMLTFRSLLNNVPSNLTLEPTT